MGHDVTIASVAEDAWETEWKGVRLLGLRRARWARLRLGSRSADFQTHAPLVALTHRRRYDVVQGHVSYYLRFLRAGIRIAYFQTDPLYRGNDGHDVSLKPADFRAVNRDSDVIIGVSGFVQSQLERNVPRRVAKIYNGVDSIFFDPERWVDYRRQIRAKWGVSEGDVVFFYAGAIVPEKGVLHLARAFARLAERDTRAHLAIAGGAALWDQSVTALNPSRAYEEQVHQALATAAAAGRVHFLGRVPTNEMPGAYASGDVVVVPSVWQEAFGLVALEGLALGLPVIASATGGLPEVVHPSNSLLVQPGDESGLEDALSLLACDPGLRRRLGEAARPHALKFSWERTAQALEIVYEDYRLAGKG